MMRSDLFRALVLLMVLPLYVLAWEGQSGGVVSGTLPGTSVTSDGADLGDVLTADGAGGAAFQAATAGGGTAEAFQVLSTAPGSITVGDTWFSQDVDNVQLGASVGPTLTARWRMPTRSPTQTITFATTGPTTMTNVTLSTAAAVHDRRLTGMLVGTHSTTTTAHSMVARLYANGVQLSTAPSVNLSSTNNRWQILWMAEVVVLGGTRYVRGGVVAAVTSSDTVSMTNTMPSGVTLYEVGQGPITFDACWLDSTASTNPGLTVPVDRDLRYVE